PRIVVVRQDSAPWKFPRRFHSPSHSRQVFVRELQKSQKVRLLCICFLSPFLMALPLMARRRKAIILGSSAAASKSHGDFCMPILSDGYPSEQDNKTIDRHDSD
ncbi:hypothetical protein BHE74_00046632, partial [Ensete ventricosum]